MTKAELVDKLASEGGITKVQANKVLGALVRIGKAADLYALCSCLCDDLLDRGDDLRRSCHAGRSWNFQGFQTQ